jgi:hypothetical protein
MTLTYNPNRHYDELIAEALAMRYPIVGKPTRADRARAVQILTKWGCDIGEISRRLDMGDALVWKLQRVALEPLPECPEEELEGAAAQ